MNTDDKFAAARQQMAEVEASVLQALASARATLIVAEEENRSLRREAIERRLEFYTEAEFAHLLKVSAPTIARMRKAGKLKFLQLGTPIRYTSAHLALVAELFEKQEQPGVSRNRARGIGPRRIAS